MKKTKRKLPKTKLGGRYADPKTQSELLKIFKKIIAIVWSGL